MDARTEAARAAESATERLDTLQRELSGTLVRPANDGYDEARRVWNGLVNRYPAAIAYCESVPDVRAAVRVARESDLPASVRSGGHHVAGSCVAAAGLVIDCSRLDFVRIDPDARTATVGPGATWGQLDRAATTFGLATPGGVVSDTGVAGLTLGGGTGYLSRTHGLTADNLRAADVVCADGELRRASAERNSKLFWALRGGDGGFGVVTAFEFDLHSIPDELAVCDAWYPAERAPELLADFRDYYRDAPDETLVAPYFTTVPDTAEYPEHGGEDALVFFGTYAGNPAPGERELERFRSYDNRIADHSERMSYPALQSAFDAGFPHGRRYYWKSVYMNELSDGVIAALREQFGTAPSTGSSIVVWPMGGAVNRVSKDATAFRRRDAAFVCSVEAGWDDPMANGENVAWVRETVERLREAGAGGPIPNFEGDTDDAATKELYGEQYERLCAVKREYDSEGLFVGGRVEG